jgi:hypothetical protein
VTARPRALGKRSPDQPATANERDAEHHHVLKIVAVESGEGLDCDDGCAGVIGPRHNVGPDKGTRPTLPAVVYPVAVTGSRQMSVAECAPGQDLWRCRLSCS